MIESIIELYLVLPEILRVKKSYLLVRKITQIKQVAIILMTLFLILQFVTKQKLKLTTSLLLKEKNPTYTTYIK